MIDQSGWAHASMWTSTTGENRENALNKMQMKTDTRYAM